MHGWRSRYSQFWKVFLCVGISLFMGALSWATHFRFGHLSWRLVELRPDGGADVSFTLRAAFRRSGYPGSGTDGHPEPGDVILETIGGTFLFFGDGGSTPIIRFRVTEVNREEDWLRGVALDPNASLPSEAEPIIRHTYPHLGPWIAEITTCCRISGPAHVNNPDGFYRVAAEVDLRNGNTGSPFSDQFPIVNCPVGGVCKFRFAAGDPDGQELQFRLAESMEAGSGFRQPAGLHESLITPDGTYEWDTTGAAVNELPTSTLYTTQIVIEDIDGMGSAISSSAVDFLIRLRRPDPSDQHEVTRIPVKWCAVRGSPAANDHTVTTEILNGRLDAINKSIFSRQTKIMFVSAFEVVPLGSVPHFEVIDPNSTGDGDGFCESGETCGPVYPILNDPCNPASDPNCPGAEGDLRPREGEDARNECQALWSRPEIRLGGVGIVAINANNFLDPNGMIMMGRRGVGDLRACGPSIGSTCKVAPRCDIAKYPSLLSACEARWTCNTWVVDIENYPDRDADQALAHEFSHNLGLQHGDGIDLDWQPCSIVDFFLGACTDRLNPLIEPDPGAANGECDPWEFDLDLNPDNKRKICWVAIGGDGGLDEDDIDWPRPMNGVPDDCDFDNDGQFNEDGSYVEGFTARNVMGQGAPACPGPRCGAQKVLTRPQAMILERSAESVSLGTAGGAVASVLGGDVRDVFLDAAADPVGLPGRLDVVGIGATRNVTTGHVSLTAETGPGESAAFADTRYLFMVDWDRNASTGATAEDAGVTVGRAVSIEGVDFIAEVRTREVAGEAAHEATLRVFGPGGFEVVSDPRILSELEDFLPLADSNSEESPGSTVTIRFPEELTGPPSDRLAVEAHSVDGGGAGDSTQVGELLLTRRLLRSACLLLPSSVLPGSAVQIEAGGLTADAGATVRLGGVEVLSASTDPDGRFSGTFRVDESIPFGRIPVDLQASGASTSCVLLIVGSPSFAVPPTPVAGSEEVISVSRQLQFEVEAFDEDPFDILTISAIGLPAGATFDFGVPGNPANGKFEWIPGESDIGQHVVTFTASDTQGFSTPPHQVLVSVRRNATPDARPGDDQLVECSSPGGGLITLDGTGSVDPDDDSLSFLWSAVGIDFDDPTSPTPTATFPLGTTEVRLTVSDGELESTDKVLVTVQDTTAPAIAASFDPPPSSPSGGDDDDDGRSGGDDDDGDDDDDDGGSRGGDDDDGDDDDGEGQGDDDDGGLIVHFSATDVCDPSPVVAAELRMGKCGTLTVVDGQAIEFEQDDDCEVESEGGVLEIEAPSLALHVTATDASGNAAAVLRAPAPVVDDDDHDDRRQLPRLPQIQRTPQRPKREPR